MTKTTFRNSMIKAYNIENNTTIKKFKELPAEYQELVNARWISIENAQKTAETAETATAETAETATAETATAETAETAETATAETAETADEQTADEQTAETADEQTAETADEQTAETADEQTADAKSLYSCINYEDAKFKLKTMHLFNQLRKLDNTAVITVDWKKPKITVKRNNKLVLRVNVRKNSFYLRTYSDKKETITKNATFEQIQKAL